VGLATESKLLAAGDLLAKMLGSIAMVQGTVINLDPYLRQVHLSGGDLSGGSGDSSAANDGSQTILAVQRRDMLDAGASSSAADATASAAASEAGLSLPLGFFDAIQSYNEYRGYRPIREVGRGSASLHPLPLLPPHR